MYNYNPDFPHQVLTTTDTMCCYFPHLPKQNNTNKPNLVGNIVFNFPQPHGSKRTLTLIDGCVAWHTVLPKFNMYPLEIRILVNFYVHQDEFCF